MRISDWSSDVCSSDLLAGLSGRARRLIEPASSSVLRPSADAYLASLHEFFGPSVIQALRNAFLAAQLGNAVVAAQTFQHDPDLVLGWEMPTGRSADILHHLLGGGFGL